MISDALLATWAPDLTADDLRLIEKGVLHQIEVWSGRSFASPRNQVAWILDGPKIPSGGLTRFNAGEVQFVGLPDPPRRDLTGTWSVTAGTKAVTGSSGAALTELSTDAAIEIAGERHAISAITDDDTLTLATAHVAGAVAVTAYTDFIRISTRSTPSSAWTALAPLNLELEGDPGVRLFSNLSQFPPLRRSVKVETSVGWDADTGPDDLMLLMKDMVRSWSERDPLQIKSDKVGPMTITYEASDSTAEEFEARARRMSLPPFRMAA